MKSVIVCITPDLLSLKNVLLFFHQNRLHLNKKQFLYSIEFQKKRDANSYLAMDLLKPEFMFNERIEDIINGHLNEFNIGDVNITIRTGREREHILSIIKSSPIYNEE